MIEQKLQYGAYRFLKMHSFPLLIASWVLVQAYLLYSNGILTGGESTKVLAEASNLLAGKGFSANSYYMYLTEILLICFSMKLGLGYWVVVCIQMILNLTALIYFYKFLTKLSSSIVVASAGTLLLLLCLPYQEYNTFLYTESIFFSLSIIFSCFLLTLKKLTFRNILFIFIFLLFLCLTRPSGIFFAGATIIYLLFVLIKKVKPIILVTTFFSLAILVLCILNYLMGVGGEIDIILPFLDERIICGVPTTTHKININKLADGNSLKGLVYYLLHNSSQFLRLALLKTKAFFGLTRDYYSSGHNLFLIVYFYSLYALILFVIIKKFRSLPVDFTFFISLILIYWLSVIFSCDEWHNRFFLALTPFLIAPAFYLFRKKESVTNESL